MIVTWLEEDACRRPALTGGKAANLSRRSTRFPVPPGFCLTVDASRDARVSAAPAGQLARITFAACTALVVASWRLASLLKYLVISGSTALSRSSRR